VSDDKLKQFYFAMQKEQARFSDNKSQHPDCTLYHYADVQGLMGILSSRKLWMSHYEKLNDIREIKHARDLVLKIVEAHKSKSNRKAFWQKYCDIFRRVLEIGDYFICSFSTDNDNKHLWHHYAKKGGIAIGFRKKYFIPQPNMNKRKKRFNLTTVQKVHYHVDDFTAYANRLIALVENNIEDNNQKLDIELGSYLTTFFLADLPKLKNKNWAPERECRLYQFGFKDEINKRQESPQDRIFAIPRVSKGDKDVVLRRFKQKDICEVWMCSSCQISKRDIQALLHKYQFTHVGIFQHQASD